MGLVNRRRSTSLVSRISSGRSRKGGFQLQRKSRRDRLRAKLRKIKEALRQRMHDSIPEQGKWLAQVVRGYFNYHAVPTNARSLNAFRYHVTNLWRRAQRHRPHPQGDAKSRCPGEHASFHARVVGPLLDLRPQRRPAATRRLSFAASRRPNGCESAFRHLPQKLRNEFPRECPARLTARRTRRFRPRNCVRWVHSTCAF